MISLQRRAVAALAVLFLALPAAAEPTVIHWLVAHDRGHSFFAELNRSYAREIETKSKGRLKIEFVVSGAQESELDKAAFAQVRDGQAEISQLASSGVGVHVFDMPFVFTNYEQAETAFASPAGRKLVDSIAVASEGKVRGFAFTYSGGFRILAGRSPVQSLADFKGLRVRRNSGHLALFMKQLGAELVDSGEASREKPLTGVLAGKLDLEETEINRLARVEQEHPELAKQVPILNLTRHRMYVTAIVANSAFFAKLPADLQTLLASEIEALAVAERKLSISLERKNLAALKSRGARIVEFPASQRPAFAEAAAAFRATDPALDAVVRELQSGEQPLRSAQR